MVAMFHHGITNIQLRYVLVFTMCANLLVMRLFEVATSLRHWNNLGCNCCYPPATCNPNETQFYILCWCGGGGDFGNYIQAAPRKGRTKHNTAKPVGLCYWFFRDPDTTTHLLFALEHLKNSVAKNTYKIIQIQKVNWVNWHENNQMIYRIESHWGYVYVLVIYFDRAILRFLGLQHGFRQPDFWWEETCVKNKAPKSTLNHGTHGCNSVCPYLSSSDWHKSNITEWSRVAGYMHDIIIMFGESCVQHVLL